MSTHSTRQKHQRKPRARANADFRRLSVIAPPAKRPRRTKAEVQRLHDDLFAIVESNRPCTVRQAFYLATTRALVPKSEQHGYKVVQRVLGNLRRQGRLPYGWIPDNTRWQRVPRTYDSMTEFWEQNVDFYRRNLWEQQDAYVEIWTEKDALSGALYPATSKWHVPLMISRGFASMSFLYAAAEAIKVVKKTAYLYYFGDHDPSGVAIDKHIERELRRLAPDSEIHFERVAVKEQQIVDMALPTRPTKRSDSRSKSFEGESVEVDAIPPAVLRQIVKDCILTHIDQERLLALRAVELAERETLMRFKGCSRWELDSMADEWGLEKPGDEQGE